MRIVTCLVFLVFSTLIIGCGDGGAAVLKRRSNLSEVASAYHAYHEQHQRSPASVDELVDFMAELSNEPAIIDAITSLTEGDVIVIYDGRLGDAEQNASDVLAFEAAAPRTGGYVAMANGEVRVMSGKEFSDAKTLPVD